ncbi:MAG: TetR/AcrR family transcriptional regulator [Desulfobacterota bacterium]|nr:TetR/AcrR family transcriptional regulator [Thermodesulfobacteriota bacterium]
MGSECRAPIGQFVLRFSFLRHESCTVLRFYAFGHAFFMLTIAAATPYNEFEFNFKICIPRMEDSKRAKILEAATKVFAKKGFQYATIADIAREAGISTGLIYLYFENKLDVLLSIILDFLGNLQKANREKLANLTCPKEKLLAILRNFEELLMHDEQGLYLVRILNEALPHIVMIKEKSLQEKRRQILLANRALLDMLDTIIAEGQHKGLFDRSLNPCVMRQILCGAIERVVYGLFYTTYSGDDIGYQAPDAHAAVMRLIEKFIQK